MNKKGVSEIVSYVLLIVIALVISGLVFTFLKVYVPKDKPECREGINVIIESATCEIDDDNQKNLKLTVQNRGLFQTEAIYVRVGSTIKDRNFKILLNDPENNEDTIPISDWEFRLLPGVSRNIPFDQDKYLIIPDISTESNTYILEIQPATIEQDKIETFSLCPPVSQIITCS